MSKRKTSKKEKKTTTRRTARRTTRSRKETPRRTTKAVHHPEHRERLHRAKRALRALRHSVFFPKAVIHTTKMHAPERMLDEIPEQALVEHWEAIGELKSKGVEVRHSRVSTHPQLLREIELDAPVSSHARRFASRHGLVIKERRSPWRTHLEKIFG